jgi:hypothetical protein
MADDDLGPSPSELEAFLDGQDAETAALLALLDGPETAAMLALLDEPETSCPTCGGPL